MYNSNQEYFVAVKAFINNLQEAGYSAEASMIINGMKLINGFTDGWAMYLDVLLKIEKDNRLSDIQKNELRKITDAAYKAVYRKNR